MLKFPAKLAMVCSLPLAACTGDADRSAPTFDELFPEERRVTLEEDHDDPLTRITSLAPRSDGGFVVVDGPGARVLEYDAAGRIQRVHGGPGDGPGEMRGPTAAVEGPSGELHVVERGSPRHTIFWPGDSVSVGRLDGQYGFWLGAMDDGLAVGLGTREARFGIMSYGGDVRTRFGHRDTRIEATPFWIFFVQERAAVAGGRVFVNSSFEPTIRTFSASGDSLFTFGTAPPSWIAPKPPEVAEISSPEDRARVEEWVRGFTVVTGLAGVDRTLIVQYGHHDPQPGEPDNLVRRTADVYAMDGEKLVEGLELGRRLLSGGRRLYVLEAEPPNPWTISVRRFAEPDAR